MSILKSNITKQTINEFAFTKADFKKEAIHLESQINNHIFKILYCRYYDKENQNINHWKGELKGLLIWFFEKKLKKDVPKSNILWYTWVTGPELDSYDGFCENWGWFIEKTKQNYNFKENSTHEIHDSYVDFMRKLLVHIESREYKKFVEMLEKL